MSEQLLPGEGLRKLVTVRKLEARLPHPNADKLQIGCFGGWRVVIGLDAQPGDLFLFFEPDAVINGFTVKPTKIRGVTSEAYAVALKPGVDLSTALHVTKATTEDQPPAGNLDSIFKTDGVPRTDQERWQNVKPWLKQIDDYYVTRKYDGSSGTWGYNSAGEFTSNSRKQRGHDNIWTKMAAKYELESILSCTELVIQAEVIGPKIQGNPHQLPAPQIRVFDIWDKTTREYFDYEAVTSFCKRHGLPRAQTITSGTGPVDIELCQELANQEHEGVVINPATVQRDEKGSRISFKVLK